MTFNCEVPTPHVLARVHAAEQNHLLVRFLEPLNRVLSTQISDFKLDVLGQNALAGQPLFLSNHRG